MTKTKPKPKSTVNYKNCSYVHACHCVQLLYITQNRTVMIIFPHIFQTIITAETVSIGGEEDPGLTLC